MAEELENPKLTREKYIRKKRGDTSGRHRLENGFVRIWTNRKTFVDFPDCNVYETWGQRLTVLRALVMPDGHRSEMLCALFSHWLYADLIEKEGGDWSCHNWIMQERN